MLSFGERATVRKDHPKACNVRQPRTGDLAVPARAYAFLRPNKSPLHQIGFVGVFLSGASFIFVAPGLVVAGLDLMGWPRDGHLSETWQKLLRPQKRAPYARSTSKQSIPKSPFLFQASRNSPERRRFTLLPASRGPFSEQPSLPYRCPGPRTLIRI